MDPVVVYVYTVQHEGFAYEYVEAVVRDEPAINASASRRNDSMAHASPLLVDTWNRAHPENQRTYDDFSWEAPPADWVNPNTEPVKPEDIHRG